MLLRLKAYGSLRSSSSGDSAGDVLRFETLEQSIEGALQELECIDANPPSPAEDALSCEESSASESSDHEPELEEGSHAGLLLDAPAGERKLRKAKSTVGAKAKPPRSKGEKKKVKIAKPGKKARSMAPSKDAIEVVAEPIPVAATPEEPAEVDREDGDAARKLKALVTRQKAEREGWAAKLRKAKEMGLEVVSKVL